MITKFFKSRKAILDFINENGIDFFNIIYFGLDDDNDNWKLVYLNN